MPVGTKFLWFGDQRTGQAFWLSTIIETILKDLQHDIHHQREGMNTIFWVVDFFISWLTIE
jgi:hypothetical protein